VIGRIGLDSNVAIRWLFNLSEGEAAADRVRKALDQESGEVHLNLVVLAELVWVARHTMKLAREGQIAIIEDLLAHPRIVLPERACVAEALAAFRKGGPGFADHLIAALNRAAGCRTTLTFDKVAARAEGFALLP
jgi:predicted nucleic-acid-binding protein